MGFSKDLHNKVLSPIIKDEYDSIEEEEITKSKMTSEQLDNQLRNIHR